MASGCHPLQILRILVLTLCLAWVSPQLARAQDAGTGTQTSETRLERLFQRLKEAPNAEAAKPIASQIEKSFERSSSDTADLLLQRVKAAMDAKNFLLALDVLDHLIPLKPDWAEPYHRRATVHFLLKDEDAAMRDIRATLAREPRHFHALAGLGAMLRMMGNKKGAYRAFEKVVDIHPYFEDLRETLAKMKQELDGQPI